MADYLDSSSLDPLATLATIFAIVGGILLVIFLIAEIVKWLSSGEEFPW